MLLEKAVDFWEVREDTTDAAWDFVRAITPGDLGMMYLDDPQLSHDGLRVTFSARNNAGVVGIYGATRTSVMNGFTSALLLVEKPLRWPFLSADCHFLYAYDAAVDGVVRYAGSN